MAGPTSQFDYIYDGKLDLDVIYQGNITGLPQGTSLANFFRIYTGILSHKQISLQETYKNIVKKHTFGNCERSAASVPAITNKRLDVSKLNITVEYCEDVFEQIIGDLVNNYLADNGRYGLDRDVPDSQIESLISSWILSGVSEDVFRNLFFGVLADGDTDFNYFNGLIYWLLGGSDSQDYDPTTCTPRTAWDTTGSTDGEKVLNTIVDLDTSGADRLLTTSATADKVMWLSDDEFLALRAYLSKTVGTADAYKEGFEWTADSINYWGIPILPINNFSANLADSAFTAEMDKLLIYTTRDNLAIGTGDPANQEELVGTFDPHHPGSEAGKFKRVFLFEGSFEMGTQLLHCKKSAIATSIPA